MKPFLILAWCLLLAFGGGYAAQTSSKNADDLRNAQEQIIMMRMDVREVKDNVAWFRTQV